MQHELTRLESHFKFGKNWASYAKSIDTEEITHAETGLMRLLGGGSLRGKRFLDIGSGSGIHSLAALRLGASAVHAIDLDPDSIETTKALIAQHSAGSPFVCEQRSVFDLDRTKLGPFDVVYSWGVLHHTGAMKQAIQRAADMVAPNGLLVLALYRKTRMCWFWRVEKRWYTNASTIGQQRARNLYVGLLKVAFRLRNRSFQDYVSEYPRRNRGMDFMHDVHDWLGGFPYESVAPEELDTWLIPRGFSDVRRWVQPGRRIGLFGTGCDEFVYQLKPT